MQGLEGWFGSQKHVLLLQETWVTHNRPALQLQGDVLLVTIFTLHTST